MVRTNRQSCSVDASPAACTDLPDRIRGLSTTGRSGSMVGKVNQAHLDLLVSDGWRDMLRDYILPFALGHEARRISGCMHSRSVRDPA